MTGILCPACGSADNGVTDTRAHRYGWRRRRACSCGERFTTLELVVTEEPRVVQLAPMQGGVSPIVREVEPEERDLADLAERIAAAVDQVLGVAR